MMKKVFAVAWIILVFISCNKTPYYITIEGFAQGTTYRIVYESKDSVDYQAEIENLLARIDTSLSTYNKSSLITQINSNTSNLADNYLRTVILKSIEVYDASNGAFDITVAPFVNMWGFGFANKEDVTTEKIDSILEFVGLNRIQVTDSAIIKSDPRIKLDVNGIAQGYSVDLIANLLDEKGSMNYLVEIGGEVKTKGLNKKDKPWRIGIDKPFDNNFVPGENLQAIVELSDKSLATSGNYRKFYEEDGKKYSHTINPKTGFPVNHSLLSVSVLANDCMTADAFATAFLVMGLEKSLPLVEKLQGIDAFFIYTDTSGTFQVKSTPGISDLIREVE